MKRMLVKGVEASERGKNVRRSGSSAGLRTWSEPAPHLNSSHFMIHSPPSCNKTHWRRNRRAPRHNPQHAICKAKYKLPDLLCTSLVTLGTHIQPYLTDKCQCALIRPIRHNSRLPCSSLGHTVTGSIKSLIHGVKDLHMPTHPLPPGHLCGWYSLLKLTSRTKTDMFISGFVRSRFVGWMSVILKIHQGGLWGGRRGKKMLIGRRSKMPFIAQGQLIIVHSQLHIYILYSIFNQCEQSEPAASSEQRAVSSEQRAVSSEQWYHCLHSKIIFRAWALTGAKVLL